MKHGRAITGLAIVACVLAGESSTDAGTLKLAWDPPTDGVTVGYIIWGGRTPGNYSESINVGAVTSYEIGGLPEGVKFYFAIQSYNASGELSPLSEEVSGMIAADSALIAANTGRCTQPPGVPRLIADVTGISVHLSWFPGPGEPPAAYLLDVGSAPGESDITHAPLSLDTNTLVVRWSIGTYFLRLTATNLCGGNAAELTVNTPGQRKSDRPVLRGRGRGR